MTLVQLFNGGVMIKEWTIEGMLYTEPSGHDHAETNRRSLFDRRSSADCRFLGSVILGSGTLVETPIEVKE